MELRFSPLFSGSSGNSTYVGHDDVHILVDAGVSCSKVVQELKGIGIDARDLRAIFVTHEHSDHIKGIGVLSRKYNIPIFATEGTWRAMSSKIGDISLHNHCVVESESPVIIGDVVVMPFSIPHDAAEPVGYQIDRGGARLAIATDLGCVKESWLKHVRGAQAVILESNYDPDMLQAGPYPYELQRRIMGRRGHLCNEDAAGVAAELARTGTKQIILGHLSKENNTPDLARLCSELRLLMADIDPRHEVELLVAKRDGRTGYFSINFNFSYYSCAQ